MTNKSDTKAVALACLTAWTSGDFDAARSTLADDVTFVGPLGTTDGAEAYVQGVRGMAQLVEKAIVHNVIAEGDDVCVMYDLVTTTAGPIPTVGWYQIRDGKVAAVRAFFDARPLAGAS
jgi:ketosteroid isomerase-like protein